MPCGGECEAELTCPRSRGSTTLHRCAMQGDPGSVCVQESCICKHNQLLGYVHMAQRASRPVRAVMKKKMGFIIERWQKTLSVGKRENRLHAQAEAGRG